MAAPARLAQTESFPEVAPSTLPEVVYYPPGNDVQAGSDPHRPELYGGALSQSFITTNRIAAHQRSDSWSTQNLDNDLYSAQLSPPSNTISASVQSSRTRLDTESFRSPPYSANSFPSQSWRERPQIQDRGFSVVSDLSGLNAVVDIVFVHGLQGHPEKTFTAASPISQPSSESTNPEKKSKNPFSRFKKNSGSNERSTLGSSSFSVFWPFDLLASEPHFAKARILTWGYNSQVTEMFSAVSHENISQQGQNFMVALQQIRKKDPSRPLIFVAHSLGGLLVKVALARSRGSKNRPQYLPIYHSTVGIVFLGTPQSGSGAADWGLLASNLAKLALRGRNSAILKGLIPNNELLENLSEDFLQILGDDQPIVTFHSFYETTGMTGIPGLSGEVVPRRYAIIGHLRETVMGIDGNHRDICKFPSLRHHGYVAVLGALEDYVEVAALRQAVQAEPNPPIPLTFPTSQEDAVQPLAAVSTLSMTSQPGPEMVLYSDSVAPSNPSEWYQDSTQSYSQLQLQLYPQLPQQHYAPERNINNQRPPFQRLPGGSDLRDPGASASTPSPAPSRDETNKENVRDVYFAVVGASGVGKSTFITRCTGREDIWTDSGIEPYNPTFRWHNFMYDGHTRINLLDTPGFDDPLQIEAYVFKDIARRFCDTYREGKHISGVIFFQKISDSLGRGSATLRNLHILQKLCGSHAYRSIALVTTHWDSNINSASASAREQDLISKQDLWGSMSQSFVSRHDNTPSSAKAIITRLLERTNETGPVMLNIQREIINDRLPLSKTSAGTELVQYIEKRMDDMGKQLLQLPSQIQQASEAGDSMLVRELTHLMDHSDGQIAADKKGLEALRGGL